jgi:hypothetical protein
MRILRMLALGSAIAAGSLALPAAPALAAQTNQDDHAIQSALVYQEIRMVSKTREGTASGDWRHCIYVSASSVETHPSCDVNVTVSASFTLSGGYSPEQVSEAVGFNISYSTSYGYGLSADVPARTTGYIDIGLHYTVYRVGTQRRTCVTPGPCGSWSGTSYQTVQDVLAPTLAFHKG